MMQTFDPERLAPDYIRKIEPYIPSAPDPELMKRFGVDHLYRLNNNENPLGPPPAAREVLKNFSMKKTSIYPSGDSFYLRDALAEKFHKDPDRFLVGNGSNEAIACVLKAFCQQGDNIVAAEKTYAVYEWSAEFMGIEARLVPLDEHYAHDLEQMLRVMDERTKVLFICNPNNPTGTWHDRTALKRFIERAGNRIVVIDEAYGEFVDDPEFPDAMELMEQYPNVICFRTFSKIYGLAGLRVGYLCGSRECIDLARRAYTVYSVNSLGQIAAREALLHGDEHLKETRRLVQEARAFLKKELTAMDIPVICGEGIFCMALMPCPGTMMYRRLMKHGVMVRTMTGFRFPNWIRVSYSTPEIMTAFVEALRSCL
jgi:histidinol-phosphate aminotransferase